MIDAMPSPNSDIARLAAEPNDPADEDRAKATALTETASAADPTPVLQQAEAEIQSAITSRQWHGATLACARYFGPDVGRLCMAMLSERALAEETAQEVFIAALEALPSYRAEAPVRAWLLGIARKKCLRALEQRRKQRDLQPEQPASERDLEQWLSDKSRAERARNALSRIKPTEREALLLRYQSDLSYEDIAAICAIDSAAARKRVSRALLRLRALVADTDSDAERGQP